MGVNDSGKKFRSMVKDKIKIRRHGFWLRFFALFSLVLCLFSLIFIYPVNLYFIGAGVADFLIVVLVYFSTPLEEVYLFCKKDKLLCFTSLQNPGFGVGKTYAPSKEVLIENIVQIAIERHVVPQVGIFLFVHLYMKDGVQYPIWLKLKYKDMVLEHIHKIIIAREDIDVYCSDERICKSLPVARYRIIDRNAPPTVDTASTRAKYRDRFTDAEWQLLLDAPLRIFLFIAKGDGVISTRELKKLTAYLSGAQSQRSLLFSEVLHILTDNIDDIRFDMEQRGICESMTDLLEIVNMKIDKIEVELLKRGLLDYAYGIARADNPEDEVPALIAYRLNELQSCLKLGA